jgi:hypothetical protein
MKYRIVGGNRGVEGSLPRKQLIFFLYFLKRPLISSKLSLKVSCQGDSC